MKDQEKIFALSVVFGSALVCAFAVAAFIITVMMEFLGIARDYVERM